MYGEEPGEYQVSPNGKVPRWSATLPEVSVRTRGRSSVVVVPVVGGAALDAGDHEAACVDVFVGGRRGLSVVVVLGEDLRSRRRW